MSTQIWRLIHDSWKFHSNNNFNCFENTHSLRWNRKPQTSIQGAKIYFYGMNLSEKIPLQFILTDTIFCLLWKEWEEGDTSVLSFLRACHSPQHPKNSLETILYHLLLESIENPIW